MSRRSSTSDPRLRSLLGPTQPSVLYDTVRITTLALGEENRHVEYVTPAPHSRRAVDHRFAAGEVLRQRLPDQSNDLANLAVSPDRDAHRLADAIQVMDDPIAARLNGGIQGVVGPLEDAKVERRVTVPEEANDDLPRHAFILPPNADTQHIGPEAMPPVAKLPKRSRESRESRRIPGTAAASRAGRSRRRGRGRLGSRA